MSLDPTSLIFRTSSPEFIRKMAPVFTLSDSSTQTPPPADHHHKKSTSDGISMLCYALIIVGTASVVLGVINLFVLRWCAHLRRRRAVEQGASTARGQGLENPARQSLLSSFKYRKGAAAGEQECAVCLSALEDGEEVRQLPDCKHSFHAPCIDMWLPSHSDCPVCRTPVTASVTETAVDVCSTSTLDNSREGLLGLDSRSLP